MMAAVKRGRTLIKAMTKKSKVSITSSNSEGIVGGVLHLHAHSHIPLPLTHAHHFLVDKTTHVPFSLLIYKRGRSPLVAWTFRLKTRTPTPIHSISLTTPVRNQRLSSPSSFSMHRYALWSSLYYHSTSPQMNDTEDVGY